MLKNAPILAIRGVDAAEIWPSGRLSILPQYLVYPLQQAVQPASEKATRVVGTRDALGHSHSDPPIFKKLWRARSRLYRHF